MPDLEQKHPVERCFTSNARVHPYSPLRAGSDVKSLPEGTISITKPNTIFVLKRGLSMAKRIKQYIIWALSAYAFYFPCDADKSLRGKLRDQMGEKIIDHISLHMPNFRELITDKAIFSADHFATMEGATNGDWTHGLLHPDQMVGDRSLLEGAGHTTPIENLFLCGASCHPGPGVTFLPGYNCAHEVMAAASGSEQPSAVTSAVGRAA